MNPRRAAVAARLIRLAIVAAGVAACGSTPGPTRAVLPTTLATPSASAAPAATASPAGGSPGASPVTGFDVVVDQGLLSFIPIGGNGLMQSVDPETTAQVAQDPSLRANASGLFMAMYTLIAGTSSAGPGDDIAVVSVVRLRDPAADDAWFRDWRDSYDTAACANAGGVSRHAQTDIGTHTVFIGSCAGGSFTYHTRVADGAIVISIASIGPAHLGETVMERLAP